MKAGRIIFLNGTSSAGKTTLANALRQALQDPFCYYASDQLADAGFRTTKPFAKKIEDPDERSRFFDGFHRSIVSFAEAGNDMIVEHIVEESSWAEQLHQLLAPFDTFWVGVHAPIEAIEERERARGNRFLGEGKFHVKTHDYCKYDIEVDTSHSLDTIVSKILSAWKRRVL